MFIGKKVTLTIGNNEIKIKQNYTPNSDEGIKEMPEFKLNPSIVDAQNKACMGEKTITHEGKVYEIGKSYLFSDDGDDWYGERLDSIHPLGVNSAYPFDAGGSPYAYIRGIPQSEIGTIKDVPVELVDGEAYVFDHRMSGGGVKGIWCEDSGRFHNVGWFDRCECKNIRKMVIAGET